MKASNLALLGAVAVAVGAVSKKARAPVAASPRRAEKPQRSGNILVRVYQDAADDRLFAVAAGVAFYALLAIAPALAVAVSVFGLFADPAQLAKSVAGAGDRAAGRGGQARAG